MSKIVKKSNRNPKSQFKTAIVNQLTDLLSVQKEKLWDLIQIPKSQTHGQFTLPIPRLLKLYPQQDKEEACNKIVRSFEPDSYIESVTIQGRFLNFKVNRGEYIKETLLDVFEKNERYRHTMNNQTVLIHFGSDRRGCHLRSTILGRFIQKIYEDNGYNCIAINDLQDEKTQNGLLVIGYNKYQDSKKMEHNPIEHLDDIYTKISQDMKHDPEKITKQISAYLKKLDEGDTEAVQQWEKLWIHRRQLHKEDYKRLGVRFDFILNELETERYIPRVYQLLEEKDLCELSEDGSLVMYLSRYDPNLGKPVVRKADGTSTHLTKDIANILMCHEKYGDVEKMIYVADIDQERYFKQLFRIVNLMLENTSPCSELIHVAFGKILNMSVIPLKQVLDTAKEKTLKVIKEDMKHGKYVDILKEGISVNGRNIQGEEAVDYIADTLGISAILTQDMAVKRTRQYRFLWDKMTDARGDTGIFLQYTHARICGIERKLDMPVSAHCHFSLLNEPEAFELVYAISLYPDIIQTAFQTLDSCTVVTYLFKLAHMISQANYNLRIKDVNPNLAEARLLLFWAAKTTLANGMRLIGLCPLERM